ncbi:MAG: cytochrome c biogenesis protein CcsA [Gammaproteobacteria bacterium]|nr:cytochrome c biogenesis protein CcsA [Gammaproteobacteria bacterium]MDE0248461.1 cytochrome c biogenesis protein CcsA [Gammaproteobacteria bacterium]
MTLGSIRRSALVLGIVGVVLTLVFHWMVFFWVSTEATLGISQRIFYIHVAGMWSGLLAFIVVAVCSAMYLWLRDDRLDEVGRAAAEGGIVFFAIGLTSGPLWARLAWGTWWTWEPRLTLSLLAFFIYIGYLLVRNATDNPEKGKMYAAVVGLVAAVNIPLIHVSVFWLRSLHPEPVVVRADGPPALPPDMLITLMTALLAWTILLASLVLLRYTAGRFESRVDNLALEGG